MWKRVPFHDVAAKLVELRAFIAEWLSTRSQRLDIRQSKTPISRVLKLIKALPSCTALRVLHLPCSTPDVNSPDESLCVQNALKEVLPEMHMLGVLGIHRLQLHPQHLAVLSYIFNCTRTTLTGLAVTLRDWQFTADQQAKVRFFEAVVRLRNLRVLALPGWHRFVDGNHAVLSPLRRLEELTCLLYTSPSPRD